MSNIIAVLARVVVDDLDEAVPLYQALAGGGPVQRFDFGGVSLANVGPFILLAGPAVAQFANRTATLLVRDLESVVEQVVRAGGRVLDGPGPSPNGVRLIARNPDGAVFEYIQPDAPRA